MKKKILPIATLFLVAGLLPACSNGKGGSGDATTPVSAIYTISFNYCDGVTAVTRKSGTTGTEIYLPEGKNSGGKQFAGWSTGYNTSTKSGDLNKVVSGSKYKIGTKNEVLYAAYQSAPSHTTEEVEAYVNGLKQSSENNHLYYHYYRFDETYTDWDVWAWSYKPDAGEGAKFDFKPADEYGGAYVDIDLSATYDGGWDAQTKHMGGIPVKYEGATQIGLQIVKTSTRQSSSGFWVNDGSNLYVALEDYAMPLNGGGTAYHVFVVQDNVQNPAAIPSSDNSDPFENDDGTNTTFGNSAYDNVAWNTSASTGLETSAEFKEVGVGYQIMVSSFADSDGDGSGDIYGITQKLGYLEKLGVKALWLTPIQLSDSYHGYDITDYEKVDPKFGSALSTAGVQNGGVVTSETALADYKELIQQAHAKGMKIVMDLVLNHTSTSNKWFVSSANLDPNYRGFYQWGNHNTQAKIKEENNWYPYGDHPYSFYAKFGSGMPELNFSYKSTREAVEDMSVYWAKEIGVDGFRLDAVKHIYMENEVSSIAGDTIVYDKSASGDYSSDLTKNLHFFKELKSTVTKESGKNVFFVGENFDGHAYHVAPYYEAFDSLFDFYSYFNLTSAAATGRYDTASKYGTVKGFMVNNSPYTISADTSTTSGVKDNHGDFAKANNSPWNFVDVYKTYNAYRNDVSMPGLFTSNHDIARVINRIAGSGDATGISAQGNISVTNYASFEKSANCVKIAELMFPGLTWIYYGDEIGMTGNFPAGKTAQSDYADLYYRQPMKWVQGGTKGDEYGTTDYYVTGSSMKVAQDEVNASTAVQGALAQAESSTSDFSVMKAFIALKNADNDVGKALRIGSIEASEWVDGELCSNVLTMTRKYGSTTIKVVVNFNQSGLGSNLTLRSGALSGTVLASYNGATQTSLPGYSAIVIKGNN